ncbi:MAG: alpha-L-fucosidase [Clostridia bacterium]|nr:alpha-L-fucosidase [Clostridia bacterium]
MYIDLDFDKKLVNITPSSRQLKHQQMEFYAFVHFTVNTFTDMEWGDGSESPEIFNPTQLDCTQWVEAVKSAGMTGLILTAKHHDGFCLWPSEYTQHSIKNSPYKNGNGDIVKEAAEACRKGGIKFGIYLSPWDRNCPLYGQGKSYDDYYCNQLTELLTNYGELFSVWFDGACGEGPNGKKQVYDWERYYDTVRRLQPDACISVSGPDVRWCGNEAGDTRESEWSVVAGAFPDESRPSETDKDLGSRDIMKRASEMIWKAAEVDTSIRPGWFYHKNENTKVRSLKTLTDIYYRSVGGNCTLLLNIPPDTRGLFSENDVKRLSSLGKKLKEDFSRCLSEDAEFSSPKCKEGHTADMMKTDSYDTYFATDEGDNTAIINIEFPETRKIRMLVIKENILFSQRIESFTVECQHGKGWKHLYSGTTVGYKKIIRLRHTSTNAVRITVTDSRVNPVISHIAVY